MSRADDLRETIAGLEQAQGFIAKATRALFEVFPGLNEDPEPAEDRFGVLLPEEASAMRSALSEAGSYLGDAVAELERFAREEDERPDLDEAIEEIADAVVETTRARVASRADHYDLVTETVFDKGIADRVREELATLARDAGVTLVLAPSAEEVEAALAAGAAIGGWALWRCALCGRGCAGHFGCPSCRASFEDACPYSSRNAKR